MTNRNSTQTTLSAIVLLLWSCGHRPLVKSPEALQSKSSSIGIEYTVGNNFYKIELQNDPSGDFKIEAFKESSAVESGKIIESEYIDFFMKAQDVHTSLSREADSECKSPIRLTLRLESVESKRHGCRSAQKDRRLGLLIRDAEFLLSKSSQ